ncbi:MAG TPA: alpha/beta fold hydrolase [Steroidobacteraceae bacterium]|jgi:pimeloyl-ACP methyl ester carboxylesterase|nr:alpha/beta fold hydrolase [Steroidobacteraceae bacterium]
MIKVRRAIRTAPADPRVRRAYFDCRYGQLHMHYAIPAGGGFDEATALLCIPASPGRGRFFQPLLQSLGRDRSVYAPDIPGCGESDPPAEPVDASQLGAALGDFLDSMYLRHVDLLAHGDGVDIALALVQQRTAQIGRVVLSPGTEAVRTEARALRHPALVIDLQAAGSDGRDAGEIERQAGQLRDFLGLA